MQLNSKQIGDWRAFSEVYPFGEIRDDVRFAMMTSKINRALTGKADFMECLLPESLSAEDRDKRFLHKMRRVMARKRE